MNNLSRMTFLKLNPSLCTNNNKQLYETIAKRFFKKVCKNSNIICHRNPFLERLFKSRL